MVISGLLAMLMLCVVLSAPAEAASKPKCVGLKYSIKLTPQNTVTIHFTPVMKGAKLKKPVSTVAVTEVNNLPGSRDTSYNRGLGVDVVLWRGWQLTYLRVSVQDARIMFSNRYYVCPNKLA